MTSDFPPVFVVGSQRSGTTILRLMLTTHSNLSIPFETNCIPKYYINRRSFGSLRDDANVCRLVRSIQAETLVKRGSLARIDPNRVIDRLRGRSYADVIDALFSLNAQSQGKRRWGDKTPGAEVNMMILNRIFPNALFLHVIRDGRDVAVSQIRTWNKCVILVAHDWAWKVATGRQIGATLGERYLEIRYEDLMTSTEDTLKRVCRWMNEPFETAMLDPSRCVDEIPTVSRAIHRRSTAPPDPSRVFAWRNQMNLGDVAIFESIAGPLLRELGYECSDSTRLTYRVRKRLAETWYAMQGRVTQRSPVVNSLCGIRGPNATTEWIQP